MCFIFIASFFSFICLDHEFNHYVPSVVASSAIAASRVCLKITPIWSLSLLDITKYEYTSIEDSVNKLLR